jgi:hypothetical protein
VYYTVLIGTSLESGKMQLLFLTAQPNMRKPPQARRNEQRLNTTCIVIILEATLYERDIYISNHI